MLDCSIYNVPYFFLNLLNSLIKAIYKDLLSCLKKPAYIEAESFLLRIWASYATEFLCNLNL